MAVGDTQNSNPANIARHIHAAVFVGFSVMLILMLVMAGTSYYNLSMLDDSLHTIIDENNVANQHIHRLGSIARERSIILNRVINDTDPFSRDEDLIRYSELAGEFIENRIALENIITSPQALKYLEQIKLELRRTQQLHERVVTLVQMNEIEQALQHVPDALSEQQKVINLLEEMASHQQQLSQTIEQQMLSEFNDSYMIVTGIAIFFVLIGLLVSVIVVRKNDHQHQALVESNTELEKANAVLEEATRSAKRANQIRSEFIANMSHELRTPMTSIKGSLGMLNSGMFPDLGNDVLNLIQIADDNADRLLGLITDILDFSKLEAGDVELNLRDTNIRQHIERMTLPFKLRADKECTELVVNIDENFPAVIKLDFEYLAKVLTQLLDNAFKFTDKGSIVLDISQVPEKNLIHFMISDSGPGISPESLEGIFESFVQGDGSSTRKYGGTGLGLSICHKIVTAMNGEIGVDSVVGKGSTFWFNLPLFVAEKEVA